MGGDGSWTEKDRVITLALTMYEAGLCGACGQPMSICRDPESEYELHEDTCQAKALIDRRHQEQAKAKTDPEPGLVLSARLETDDGEGFAVNPFQ